MCFDFEIDFENLSKVELGALLWVLNIAKDDQYRLSLGMGKPLGMGAVKVSSQLHLSDRPSRYTQLFDNNQWMTGDYTTATSDVEALITDFEKYICETPPLKEVRRIKMLLTMLNWQNYPSLESTRYMEIERDTSLPHIGTPKSKSDRKINEYSRRPILPTPLQVIDNNNGRSASGGRNLTPESGGSVSAAFARPKRPK